jgi:transposase
MPNSKPYPTDVSEEEWTLVAPYLALVREDASQRVHKLLRKVFDALRWIGRAGAPWRLLPHDFLPWEAVYRKPQKGLHATLYIEAGSPWENAHAEPCIVRFGHELLTREALAS